MTYSDKNRGMSKLLHEMGLKSESGFWWHGNFDAFDGDTRYYWVYKAFYEDSRRVMNGKIITEDFICHPLFDIADILRRENAEKIWGKNRYLKTDPSLNSLSEQQDWYIKGYEYHTHRILDLYHEDPSCEKVWAYVISSLKK